MKNEVLLLTCGCSYLDSMQCSIVQTYFSKHLNPLACYLFQLPLQSAVLQARSGSEIHTPLKINVKHVGLDLVIFIISDFVSIARDKIDITFHKCIRLNVSFVSTLLRSKKH